MLEASAHRPRRALAAHRATLALGFASCFVALASGCTGEISGAGANSAGSPTANAGAGTPTPSPVNVGDLVGVDPQQLSDGVPPTGRVLRLSYDEYDRALKDLLHLPVDESANFPAEQSSLG